MTLNEIEFLLIGAALVAFGVVAGAVAEHIRGWRFAREYRREARRSDMAPEQKRRRADSPVRGVPVTEAPRHAKPSNADAHLAMGREVAAVLVASGYSKRAATNAVNACTNTERYSLEMWVAAALRRCARSASDSAVCS